MTRRNKNYLEYIPVKNTALTWETRPDGAVVICRVNDRWAERLTQFLFKKPKATTIRLEEYGTFIWPLIDGKRSIHDIALLVRERFGAQAEPVYARLAAYFRSMDTQRLIRLTEGGRG